MVAAKRHSRDVRVRIMEDSPVLVGIADRDGMRDAVVGHGRPQPFDAGEFGESARRSRRPDQDGEQGRWSQRSGRAER